MATKFEIQSVTPALPGWYAVYAECAEHGQPIKKLPVACWALCKTTVDKEDEEPHSHFDVIGMVALPEPGDTGIGALDLADYDDTFLGYDAPGAPPRDWVGEAVEYLDLVVAQSAKDEAESN
jgi:hypothetical protein